MNRRQIGYALAWCALQCSVAWSAPSVYPTGTTRYDPEQAFSGFTVLTPLGEQAVVVMDMNGNVVKAWDGHALNAGGPARVLPGGFVIAPAGANPPLQESLSLVEKDFDGNVIWEFSHNERIDRDGGSIWALRQHHDWQRTDFPAGYYSPSASPEPLGATTLILTHTNRMAPNVSATREVMEDRLIEVTIDGEILWEWIVGDHIDEFGFSAAARETIANPAGPGNGGVDWFHMNSATYLGPNQYFDAGDERFAPDNIIISSRQASVVAILDHASGEIVWRLGPDFSETPEMSRIRQIIGQHHAHMIPQGLPGAGNIMIFDNGGSSGYGAPSSIAPTGVGIYARATSRIVEINPVTLELVWSYAGPGFFSTNISGAQRLPNGNTFITEGATGRLFEVTADGDIVWEYMHPVFSGARGSNTVYRGYRIPYAWIPQLEAPAEIAITPPPRGEFRVP